MGRKGAKSRHRSSDVVKIVLEHIPASDAQERLARAFHLVLQAAAKAQEDDTAKEKVNKEKQ